MLAAAGVVLAAGVAFAAYGPGALGYDASWALLWGDDVAHGDLPGYEESGAPTPHPLLNAVCAVLAPFGDGAGDVLIGLTMLSLGALVYAGYLLGARLFSAWVGALYAALLLTRATLGGEAAQALVDVPYLALVVAAAAVEARTPRAGTRVLALLSLAGLLRPEGWLLAAAYAAYLLPPLGARERVRTVALAASAPLVWALSDLVITGDALFSLHTTRDLAEQLNRPRDLRAAVETAPEYLESVLGTGVALTGLAGCVLAVVVLYERAALPLSVLGLGLLAFMALGVAGLPILTRYLLVPGVVLALFCAVTVAGWTALPQGDRRRTGLQALALVCVAGLAVAVPADVRRHQRFQRFTDGLHRAQEDLREAATAPRVRPVAERSTMLTGDHRAVPLLALWLDRPPAAVATVEWGPRDAPLVFAYADSSDAVELAIPRRLQPPLPPAGRILHSNRTWTAYVRRGARSEARSRTTRKRRLAGAAGAALASSGVSTTR